MEESIKNFLLARDISKEIINNLEQQNVSIHLRLLA